MSGLRDLLSARFRANDAFRLVRHSDLPAEQQHVFSELAEDPEHFGVLLPRGDRALGILVIDRSTASLLSRLDEPSSLPDDVLASDRHDANRQIARLIVDGVLAVESPHGFVTGPTAHPTVFETPYSVPAPHHTLVARSHAALRLAEQLPVDDPTAVSSWLYSFHTIPISPAWARRYGSPERIEPILGLRGSTPTQQVLEEGYVRSAQNTWNSWRARTDRSAPPTPFKLYVSPHPSCLGEVFRTVVQHIEPADVPALKIGSDVYGLLRPDKLMLYFERRDVLHRVADALQPALSEYRSHGVPFTAPVDGEGMLSWGIDPPISDRIPGWRGSESWRVWVIDRLARAMIRSRALGGDAVQPWLCALDRLRLEGVDTDRWLPDEHVWLERGRAA